jgi:predicted Zn-dependent peptidase
MKKNGQEDINYTKFDNGIEVITERLPHFRSVALAVWMRAGSRLETPEVNGISHFIEHLVFKGTESLSSKEISSRVDEMGGSINAFTSREEISFYLKILDTEIERGVNLLADIVLGPAFREEDIKLERGVILEEIRMIEDSPEETVADFFLENFWKDHPLGSPVQGKEEIIAGLGRDQIAGYYGSVLDPGRLIIAAAGGLEHSSFLSLIRERFGALSVARRMNGGSIPAVNSFNLTISKPNLEQVRLVMGIPGIAADDADRYNVMLLSMLLGGNSSSRLFQKAREERGLVYDISAFSLSYSDCGVFAVAAGAQPGTIPELLGIIHEELEDVCRNAPSEKELERLKSYVKGNMVMSLEGSSSRMNRLARHIMYYHRYIPLDEVIQKIDKISVDDILRSAQRLLKGKWSLALIKPENGLEIDENLLSI